MESYHQHGVVGGTCYRGKHQFSSASSSQNIKFKHSNQNRVGEARVTGLKAQRFPTMKVYFWLTLHTHCRWAVVLCSLWSYRDTGWWSCPFKCLYSQHHGREKETSGVSNWHSNTSAYKERNHFCSQLIGQNQSHDSAHRRGTWAPAYHHVSRRK